MGAVTYWYVGMSWIIIQTTVMGILLWLPPNHINNCLLQHLVYLCMYHLLRVKRFVFVIPHVLHSTQTDYL